MTFMNAKAGETFANDVIVATKTLIPNQMIVGADIPLAR